ncbi:MAG: hypothetical protein GQ527_04160 [Bacteroidales bacterium]|nr:hypothetical protein [Bacteroidales bacterium]
MDNILKKVFYFVSLILILIATAYQVVVLYQGGGDEVSESVMDGYFYVAYAAFGISLVLALIFPIIQMAANPKGAIRTFAGLAIAVVLWFIASAFAGNDFTALQLEEMEVTAETSALVGTGLIYTYFIFGLAVLSIIYAGVSNMFK